MILASAEDVQTLMPGVILDEAQVNLLLEIATGTIQDFTGQMLGLVEDDEIRIRATFGRSFQLPERPVLSVASITLEDEDVAASAYRWGSDGKVTFARSWEVAVNGPLAAQGGSWGGSERFLNVVYTHGYEVIPPSIKGVCIDLVRRGIVAPDADIIGQESLGSYNVSYNADAASVLSKPEENKLRRYRQRNTTVLVGP